MKKFIKKVLIIILLIFIGSISVSQNVSKVFAKENDLQTSTILPSQSGKYTSYEYVIDKYDVNINVNENNTFDIIETIDVYFNVEKHGIYRNIPLKNKILRFDGTTSTNKVQISNLTVNSNYETTRENGNLKIKIGSEDKILTGSMQYIIKYNYNIGKDPIKEYDEFYFNIIGDKWDTVIGNITFSITMPKTFDTNELGFSSGSYNSNDSSNIVYVINDKTIKGNYNGVLNEKNAITIRCKLPEGYFVNAGFKRNIVFTIMYIFPILFLIISLFLWLKFGRNEKVEEKLTYYPPTGFNSLEVGFLYKGKAENHDVISLLLYLGNKGYLKIEKLDKKTKEFKIIKLKDYDGDNENEKTFLDGLFNINLESTSSCCSRDEVTSTELNNNFYTVVNKILLNVNSKENRYKIIEKSSANKKIFIILMIIATFFLITIPAIFTYGNTEMFIFALICPGLGFTLMISFIFSKNKIIYINGKVKYSSFIVITFAIVWGLMFGGIPFVLMLLPSLLQDIIYLIGYIVGLICVFVMIICLQSLSKRTPYGNKMFGEINGFKKYLESVKREEIEIMQVQNPTYFYDLLPYCYVLGVSNEWMKKFENITLNSPIWYVDNNEFNIDSFYLFMNNTMDTANSSMSSSPSSTSSGGGVSSGGSGGGGGSSW